MTARLPLLPTTRDLDACVMQLKVLADPTRLSVLRLLLTAPHQVNELSAKLSVEQSLLSHHLRQLREAHLVETERVGKGVLYRVASGVQRSFSSAEAIDLGCCQLSFADTATGRPRGGRSRT